jgi:hypothetical protein
MTFRTVGQALRWYAQAGGLPSCWPDACHVPGAGGKQATREDREQTLAIIAVTLALLDPADRELLLDVRVRGLALEAVVAKRRRSLRQAVQVAEWQLTTAERIVAKRLRQEGVLTDVR